MKIIVKIIIIIVVLVLLFVSYILVLRQPIMNYCCAYEYQHFNSPDKKYSVVVYSTTQFFAMPGSSGDASGFAQLINDKGEIIYEIDVDMVQQIENESIYWSKDEVYIKHYATWKLE